MRRRGFTIIELVMVIGILAVLVTLLITSTAGAMKEARNRKGEALVYAVRMGLSTYYGLYGKWPGTFGERVFSGTDLDGLGRYPNRLSRNGHHESNLVDIQEPKLIHEMIRELVKETKHGNPMIDVSALYVSKSLGEQDSKSYGMDFMDAIRGTKQNPKKMKLSDMNFGYPEPDTGYFRCFRFVYNKLSDELRVLRWGDRW